MDSDSVRSSYPYRGQEYNDLSLANGDCSAFSECNSDRSGEFTAASAQSRRLFVACATENSDELISCLVSALDSTNIDEQKQAAMQIRLLAKNKADNRIRIAEAGAIKPLISLISSNDPQLQEYGVTAILNLSLCDENKEEIASSGAILPLVHALKFATSTTAKENAACALLRLSQIEKNKTTIGQYGAIPPLVNLLETGSFRGKKDACTALFSLCSVKENKLRAVHSGIMKPLVELMSDFGSNMVDKSAFVLSLLMSLSEARTEMVEEGGIPVLVEIVEVGTQRQKEIAVSILSQLCEDCVAYRTMVAREGAIPPLIALSQTGTSRAKHKVKKSENSFSHIIIHFLVTIINVFKPAQGHEL
ncbi:U-box domain-containing protein 4-like [Dorcoceras hygrometricum]|uniref:RING-type E3 ubiquitin transferase n=1 Tax=Dorcoceras hygrometricum TaxID=472368 RepID=A0A2Z7CDV2_9LAMI|nr:U-box domain-containing protein 4-like [Dorcoceras hygrometricum]